MNRQSAKAVGSVGKLAINPKASGVVLANRFKRDRDAFRDPASAGTRVVVEFSGVDRRVILYVSNVGGFLLRHDGSKSRIMRVGQALAWYRKQVAENWFAARADYDDGWLLFLGMAEGMVKRPARFEITNGGGL